MASRQAAIALYRDLVRAGKAYPDYNIRHYVLRRSREEFQAARNDANPSTKLAEGRAALDLIRRQSAIAGMYKSDKSIMELQEQGASARR